MSIIVIEDLSENIDLDRQAMRAITGGARTSGRQTPVRSKAAGIVNYFSGVTPRPKKDTNMQRTRNTPPFA